MKPSLFLLGAGSALAFRDSISSGSGEICISSQLLAASSSNPICRNKDTTSLFSSSYSNQAILKSGPATTGAWTYTTPCFKNGTNAPEFCIYHRADYGEKGISIVTDAERAEHITRSWGFSKPESLTGTNRPLQKYHVAPVVGKDYGLVATHRIARGEVIIKETATLLIDYAAFLHVPPEEMRKMQAHAVDYLNFNHRSEFLNMSTSGYRAEDHLARVDKILVTNSFDVEMDDAKRDDDFYAVFVNTSRMNHDCRPNVDYWFDPRTLTQRTTAIRDIMPGEELTLSYIDPMQSRAARRERLLTTWGFHCSCHHCTQSRLKTDASDARIEQIASLREEFNDYTPASRATPEMAELLISLYEQEHNWSLLSEAYTLAAIEYNGIGEPWLATKYARLAIEYGLTTLWEGHGDVVEMTKLAEDPWSHWSWMLRTRKRYSWGPGPKPIELDMDDD
ncbi:SET domain-containing protein 5 [Colletotrichum sidae]|uniref:SET domain-containing protein 5 n=4 Tax=Colletotrichum orbiculare species complex TaxID=2707354 RepID=N4V0M2_COLOR|nr:SET domain-containing protein 5 [Colletotrichum orbiculare MAFF 240422]TDZ37255.1 SET domain-containing protein 5 [Colletotrichum spinosum]TDZ71904.1 SET domain-containing protein 5 [Colletotrichum trifolii]TDZ87564.1 SET domain-containing protein 5 [Colletotrichum sidae]